MNPSDPPDRLLRIERACDRFEDDWRAGRRPRLEEYLAAADEADRPALFRDLLPLDLHYRRAAGEVPAAEEYARRFPDAGGMIVSHFPQLAAEATRPMAEDRLFGPRPTLPGFEILDALGRGEMGVVYKARDTKLGRLVAVKMIRLVTVADPTPRARFLAEAQVLARMQHPHVVQIYEVGEADGCPFFVMEHVEGGTLSARTRAGPQPPAEAARLVEQLARGMAYAHDRGVVHRDLKPGNVLLTPAGEPKVADFGLAKGYAVGEELTATGVVLGTPRYMAPEQALGESKAVGPPADVYALGVILFELLTGGPPFSADTTAGLLRRVIADEPPSPRDRTPGVPPALEAICLKCLEKAPARRYPSAGPLAEDLASYLAGAVPSHARPLGLLARLNRRCRRNPWRARLAAVGLAAALVALVLAARLPPRDDSLWRVQRSGKLIVGVDANSPPYAFRTDGRLTGLDVELARAIATRLGGTAEHHELYWDWDGLRRGLDARELDILLSVITITEERSRQVAFIEYARDPLAFAARPGTRLRDRHDLAGKVLAVQDGTSAHAAADRLQRAGGGFKQIVTLRSSPELFAAVRSGAADVALDHGGIARHAGRDGTVVVAGSLGADLGTEALGIALRSESRALRAAIERVLADMSADGSLGEMKARWMGP